MLTAQSIENRISEKMTSLNMSGDFLGQLTALYNMSGFSQPRISQALRGVKAFENQKGQQLYELICEVEQLCKTSDVPILLVSPSLIKQRLDERRMFKQAAQYDEVRCSPSFGPKFSLLKVDRCLQL